MLYVVLIVIFRVLLGDADIRVESSHETRSEGLHSHLSISQLLPLNYPNTGSAVYSRETPLRCFHVRCHPFTAPTSSVCPNPNLMSEEPLWLDRSRVVVTLCAHYVNLIALEYPQQFERVLQDGIEFFGGQRRVWLTDRPK
jgi:hypothetical protein